MTHEAGKGDKQRPTDKAAFDAHYDNIFKKRDDAVAEDEEFKRIERERESKNEVH